MQTKRRRVAVLGAGIMGTSLAIFLSRRGFEVSLFDQERAPLSRASRWNEGKIHLGYLYGADASLQTARRILPGGLVFGKLISNLIGSDITPHVTCEDDLFLVHRDSVVDPERLQATFDAVSMLIREHQNANQYLVDVSTAQAIRLQSRELMTIADSGTIVAAFRIPERSINTQWLADRLSAVLACEPGITLRLNTTITKACPVDSLTGPWRLEGVPSFYETFDLIINALWEGRLVIDCTAGLLPQIGWTHRYRRCLFVRTHRIVSVASALVTVGPFGDIKNYDDRHFYLSWYPVGLVCQSSEISMPPPKPLTNEERDRFIRDVRTGVESIIPGVASVFDSAETVTVEGGFVFAIGDGSIADPKSSLHRRDRFGVTRKGNYISVDTGKYSTAPWLADKLVQEICGE